MICRWNLGTRPPIRISDIPSWTYDKNTIFVNPARYERQWNKSNVDFTIINKLSGWICWYNEINSSPDILGCCVFEGWLYCKFEHNLAILRDVFGEMLQPAPYLASVCTKTGFQLNDENTPLNVELRPCIESHFKCTIMNVKIVFRLGFGVKIQNLPGPRCNQLMWFFALQRRKCTTKFEISWMHRSAWLESNIKGTIWSEGSLSETILVRKYKISKSAS